MRNYNTLSRFWLDLSPEETYKILSDVFAEAAKSGNFLYGPDENAERGTMGWRLSLLDNRKQPLVGRVVLEREEGPDNDITLVKLERSKAGLDQAHLSLSLTELLCPGRPSKLEALLVVVDQARQPQGTHTRQQFSSAVKGRNCLDRAHARADRRIQVCHSHSCP